MQIGVGVSVSAGVVPGAVIPASVPSLQLWLRSDRGLYQDAAGTTAVAADGDPVGLWQDLSGRGNHASQSTAGSRPARQTASGVSVLRFDGVDDALAVAHQAALNGASGFTVFAVFNSTSATVNGGVMGKLDALPSANWAMTGNRGSTTAQSAISVIDGGGVTVRASTIGDMTNGSNHLLMGQYDGANVLVGEDGLVTTGEVVTSLTTSGSRLVVGSYLSDLTQPAHFAMDLMEIAFYDRSLSATERDALGAYFGARYGLTIA